MTQRVNKRLRLSSLDRALLVLSGAFVIVGVSALLFPREFVWSSTPAKHRGPEVASFTKNDCRIYGALSAVGGLCLGGLAFYPRSDDDEPN